MRSLASLALAAAAAVLIAPPAARAADMPVIVAPIEQFGGWYLRGDVGLTYQKLKGLDHPAFDNPAVLEWLNRGKFDGSWFVGLGIGYQYNNWLRVDLTGEYRGSSDFRAADQYDTEGDDIFDGTNDYSGKKTEWLFLANAYIDLGTWHGFTPFIGAGIGTSRNTISGFRDVNEITDGLAFASTGSKWELAWALHAGIAYAIMPNLTFEVAYRYLNLGDGKTGLFRNVDLNQGCNLTPPCHSMKFKDITSHDVKFGLRWAFASGGYIDYEQPIGSRY